MEIWERQILIHCLISELVILPLAARVIQPLA